MTQTEAREDVVLHSWAFNDPENGNRLLIQVTWTPLTGWSYGVWDRDRWLGGEVKLFDWTTIVEYAAHLRLWSRQDKHALRDMPERWRHMYDQHSPTTRWLAAHI